MIKSVLLLYVYLGTIVINPPSFILIIHPLILSIYQVMIVVSREMLLRCISKSLLCQSRESLQFLHWRSVSWLVDWWSGDSGWSKTRLNSFSVVSSLPYGAVPCPHHHQLVTVRGSSNEICSTVIRTCDTVTPIWEDVPHSHLLLSIR